MAEQMTSPEVPVQEAPVQAVPAQTAPVQVVPTPSHAPRKGSPLLVFLTVLLVLVGIADAILWGVVGYYFFQNSKSEAPEARDVSTGRVLAQDGSGSNASSDDEAKREALEAYIQEMEELWELRDEEADSYNSVLDADDATRYTEITERALPICQQANEKVVKVVSDDPEIHELCGMYQDYVGRWLDIMTEVASALDTQDKARLEETNGQISEAQALLEDYWRELRSLAKERNVPLNR